MVLRKKLCLMETMDIILITIHIMKNITMMIMEIRKKRKVHKKPKNKFEAFIYRLKEEYARHLSGDIKRRR